MRALRFIVLAATVAALSGCMQSGGDGIFARNAPPLHQSSASLSSVSLPEMLRPGYRRTVVQAAPAPAVMAEPLGPMPILPGAAAEPPYAPQMVAQPVMMETDGAYALDSGDKLRVVVFGQDGLNASYSVDISGNITMPLIGAVRARGMTPAGLQQAITAKLKNGYVREPHVAVEVEAYRPFFILGEVTLPGQYPYVPNMTVETAVAIAGGYTPRAFKRKIEVSHQINGLTERRVVSPNYPLRPGDTVHIAERWF
jgi:polysaccharide biosynthesis/export protein